MQASHPHLLLAAGLILSTMLARAVLPEEELLGTRPSDVKGSPASLEGSSGSGQNDCPVPCNSSANTEDWTPYHTVEQLDQCHEPMLLQISAAQPLVGTSSFASMRSCLLHAFSGNHDLETGNQTMSSSRPESTEESKIVMARLDVATTRRESKIRHRYNGRDVAAMLRAMVAFFPRSTESHAENVIFAYHGSAAAAGLYIGPRLGSSTVRSVVEEAVLGGVLDIERLSGPAVFQLCSSERGSPRTFGLAIDGGGDLPSIHRTVLEWGGGACAVRVPGSLVQQSSRINVTELSAA